MASRAGRKRKLAQRYPNGQIKRPTTMQALNEINQRKALAETAVVLMQPHRRGDPRPECATALGRFWIGLATDNKVLLTAGEQYAGLVRRWRAAWGVMNGQAPSEGAGTGQGPSEATVKAWRKQIDKLDHRLLRASGEVLIQTKRLVVDDLDLETRQRRLDALLGLRLLAINLELLGPDHPFR